MKWAEITLRVPPPAVEPVAAALDHIGCAGVVVADPGAVSSDPFADWAEPAAGRDRARDVVSVSGYLPVDDRLEPALDALRACLDRAREAGIEFDDDITLRCVDEEAWADAWKAFYKPFRVGRRLVVKPTWETWDPEPGDVVLEIDPGMAFGTGTHPSTRLCLGLLEEVVRSGDRVLDWGTGSGILAVAAARLGAAAVLAVDLDPVAVRTAAENADRNGCATVIRTGAASIESLPEEETAFDLVLANIVADPIIEGARGIARRLRPGGAAIVSGFIESRSAVVASALAAAGLVVEQCGAEEDWRALLVRRPAA